MKARKHSIEAALISLALVIGVTLPAAGYVGPGAGLSVLGALWGLLVAVGAALSFIILWPLRQIFARRRTSSDRKQGSKPS